MWFSSSRTIVGLEIGTSKICAIAGDIGDQGSLNIIGIGQARSRGVRKGEIVDHATAEEDVRHALSDLENSANLEVHDVYLGVTGGHIRGFNNRGIHPVVSADREVTQEDVEDVVKNAKAVNIPAENNVIHSIRQNFILDGQEGIVMPVGRLGARLMVDMHVVHGSLNRLQNPIRMIKGGVGMKVEAVVFNGLATALSVLSNDQKELGALVIDFGGGTTEYAVYAGGVIKHTGVLAVGGDHVTNDLAYGLKVPQSRAEQLKKEHGSALYDPEGEADPIQLKSTHGLPVKSINRGHLKRIMSMRIEEIMEIIADDLTELRLLDYIRAGVFLTGGSSRIAGICDLAEHVFQLPAGIGQCACVNGLPTSLQQPEFAAAIGLVKFGAMQQRLKPARWKVPWRRISS